MSKPAPSRLLVPAITLLLAATTVSAAEPAVTLGGIVMRVFDRKKADIVTTEESSDPYGMNVDALLLVKVQGTYDGDKPLKLTLTASAPKEETEAGSRRAWKVTQTRELYTLPEGGVAQVPFLLPYQCSGTVKVVATLTGPGIKETRKLDTAFPCAE